MIEKWYEITCDYCGTAITNYIGKKPTTEEMKNDGIICTATMQFCSDMCFADWKHEKATRQYFNLKQNGKLTHGENV